MPKRVVWLNFRNFPNESVCVRTLLRDLKYTEHVVGSKRVLRDTRLLWATSFAKPNHKYVRFVGAASYGLLMMTKFYSSLSFLH